MATRATSLPTPAPETWDAATMAVPWTESPFFDELLEASDLDDEQRRLATEFSERGYAVIDPEIPEATMDAAVEGLRGQFGKSRDSYDTRIQDSEMPAVREIALSPKVLDLLRTLYRREPIPFQTLNFEVGTQQDIHNDAIHFHCIPQRFMCGAWVALEDVDHDNGPLFYFPGSHRLPVYEMPDLGLPASQESYVRYVEALRRLMAVNGLEPEELHMRKGQAMIWAANLHHGGSAVLDPERTRLSQVTHYYFEDSLFYSPQGTDLVKGEVQLRDVRNLASGEMVPHVYRGEVIHRPERPGATMLEMRGHNGGGAEEPAQAPPAPAQPVPVPAGHGPAKRAWWRVRGKLRSMRST